GPYPGGRGERRARVLRHLRAAVPRWSICPPRDPDGGARARALDHHDRAAWRAAHSIPDGALSLSYFGFLNESKGAETLIRALALTPEARLMMVGGALGASDPTNAAYLARVKALIAELGLVPRVTWTDHIPEEEVSAALVSSDICVLPYRDGASFRRGTLMAALAHGLPIITTAQPAAALIAATGAASPLVLPRLCNGENVLLVPPDDPQALAAAINRLGADRALRARLGQTARELSLAFTWDKIAAQHLALYREVARSAGNSGSGPGS
ncbi:MAG: glycosyltransferase family 4 protein, partial [Rudaea sp.]